MNDSTQNEVDGALRVVRERLEFVEIITNLNEKFLDPKLIRHTPEGGWTHPWKYFDSLRNYLLLTTFDLLGQPSEFKDFQSWLVSRSTSLERKAVMETIVKDEALIDSMQKIHRGYLDIHGTKTSFYRFINEVLPNEMREELLHSIRICRIDSSENREIRIVDSSDKKIRFLFAIRNLYTHKLKNTGSPAGGVFENWTDPIIIDGVPKKGWEPIYYEHKAIERVEFGVRDWPDVLLRAVNTGIQIIEGRANGA